MAGTIKGLKLFIQKIRACNNLKQEEECVDVELAKIRKYFANKGLTGYDRKKCVWKLVYIATLGYDVDIGLTEAFQLMQSPAFSEKMGGYFAFLAFFNESNKELMDIATNSIRGDLLSMNELYQGLALNTLANRPYKHFVEKLTDIVVKIAFGRTENTYYIQKRGLLCLNAFYQKNTGVFKESWIEGMASLLQSKSIGVLLASLTLISSCVIQLGPAQFIPLTDRVVSLYKRMSKPHDFPSDYIYNHCLSPWLHVRVLKLLQLLPPPESKDTLGLINLTMGEFLDKLMYGTDIKYNNGKRAVLFEIINLALDYKNVVNEHIKQNVLWILSCLLCSDQPNSKYLALEALVKIEGSVEAEKFVLDHKTQIIANLYDVDLSIRKRALEGLFALCTKKSATMIVEELLTYLKEKDTYLKEELVLKIAILAERHGENMLWYIDVIMKTLEYAGNYVSDDVWIRISQIVTGFDKGNEGNEDTQKIAASRVLSLLNTASAYEPLVKLGAYLLGEFGHLIAENRANLMVGSKGLPKQLEILTRHYSGCSPNGRAMILSAITKFVVKCSAMKETVVAFLENAQAHWDLDTQQRSTEYLALINDAKFEEYKFRIFDKVPCYPESFLYNNVIMRSLEQIKKQKTLGLPKADQLPQVKVIADHSLPSIMVGLPPTKAEIEKASEPKRKSGPSLPSAPAVTPAKKEEREDLTRYQTMSIATETSKHPFYAKYMYKFAPEPTVDPTNVSKLVAPKINADNWKKLISNKHKEGVIYEDAAIAVAIKSEYVKFTGRIILKFISKGEPLHDIILELTTPAGLEMQCSKVKYSSGSDPPMAMIQMMLGYPFALPPSLSVTFHSGTIQNKIQFGLPVLLTKFLEPIELTKTKFDSVWNEITAVKPNTFQKLDTILKNPAPSHLPHMNVLKRMAELFLEYFGVYVLPPADPANFSELSVVGQILFKSKDQLKFPVAATDFLPPFVVPLLAQAEFYPELSMTEFRFSVRSSDVMPISAPILSLFKFFVNPTS